MNGRGKRLILAEKKVTARGEQRVEEHFQDRRDFSIFIGEGPEENEIFKLCLCT